MGVVMALTEEVVVFCAMAMEAREISDGTNSPRTELVENILVIVDRVLDLVTLAWVVMSLY